MSSTEKDNLELSLLALTDVNKEIRKIIKKYNCSYIDAIVHYCEETGTEIETVANIVKSNTAIKSQIKIEAEELNYLPKTSRLDI